MRMGIMRGKVNKFDKKTMDSTTRATGCPEGIWGNRYLSHEPSKHRKKKKKSRPLGSRIRPYLRSASGEDLAKKKAASEVKCFDVAE